MFRDNVDNWQHPAQAYAQSPADDDTSPAPSTQGSNRNEAQLRVKMANCYMAILDNGIFGDDKGEAAELVEQEMREFANERMEILLGMRQERPMPNYSNGQFTDDEVRALKALAASAMRKFSDDTPPQVRPISVSNQTVTQANVDAPPQIKPVKLGGSNNVLPKPKAKSGPPPKKDLAKNKKPAKVGGRPADALPMPGAEAMAMKAENDFRALNKDKETETLITGALINK